MRNSNTESSTHDIPYLKQWYLKCYLALGALQVAGDEGVFGPVQHGADLLTQF